MAAVSSVVPSPTAPKSLTDTVSCNLDLTVLVTAPVAPWLYLIMLAPVLAANSSKAPCTVVAVKLPVGV